MHTQSLSCCMYRGGGKGSEQMLQQSLLCCIHREVARDLSTCCSKLGLVHAAVLFEHASLGASVSLQYRGILHSKLLALVRRHLCGSATPEAEQASHISPCPLLLLHAHTALTSTIFTSCQCMPVPAGLSAARSLPNFKLALAQ